MSQDERQKKTDTSFVDNLRGVILENPELILHDANLMRALAKASDASYGENVVDIRTLLAERLNAQLAHLRAVHDEMLSVSYENIKRATTIQKAVLKLIQPAQASAFFELLENEEFIKTLEVDKLRLLLAPAAPVTATYECVAPCTKGFIADYMQAGKGEKVSLHGDIVADETVYNEAGIKSEACIRITPVSKTFEGMLLLGSKKADHFHETQGTDLLQFFGAVFENTLERWLI